MSIDVSFKKGIKLKELKEKLDLNITYYPESNLWVGERGNNEAIQILPASDVTDTSLKDLDIYVFDYCIRPSHPGSMIIQDIACIFQSKFLDDDGFEEYAYYSAVCQDILDDDSTVDKLEESYNNIFKTSVMPRWGLKYDDNGKIQKQL